MPVEELPGGEPLGRLDSFWRGTALSRLEQRMSEEEEGGNYVLLVD